MAKNMHESPFDEGTLCKLDIFRQYLRSWLPVFLQSWKNKRIVICDFFAGSGRDSSGVPGSPLIILDALEDFRPQIYKNHVKVLVLFGEKIKRKADLLRETIREKYGNAPLGALVDVQVRATGFRLLFEDCYPMLCKQPNLLFIDQYGIKEMNGEVLRKVAGLDRTDFLFFLSSSFCKRFITTPEFSLHLGGVDVSDLENLRVEESHRFMLDYYRGLLSPDSETRLFPFTIKKGGNIYGLIFGSSHLLGVEKFLDTAWKQNPINGEANFDIDDDASKAQLSLFEEDNKLTKRDQFEEELESYLEAEGEVTNLDVYSFTLSRGHAKGHASECVRRLRQEKKVECDGSIGFSYDSCIRKKNIKAIKYLQ